MTDVPPAPAAHYDAPDRIGHRGDRAEGEILLGAAVSSGPFPPAPMPSRSGLLFLPARRGEPGMLPNESQPPTRRRLPSRRILASAIAVLVVVALVGGLAAARLVQDEGTPGTTIPITTDIGATIGPISSGGLIEPSAPGETPVVAAASVPFARPTYPFVGPAPWQLHTKSGHDRVIEGYASRPSYLPGETLRLAVSTSAPSFDVTFWRVTGRSTDGEPFVKVGEATDARGRRQPAPTIDPVTKMVAAHWDFTFSFPIPADWTSGVYVARLASKEDVQSFVPFVVRSPDRHAVLVASSALDWEAYNDWGGSSVYRTRVGQPMPGVTRALAVSFDRPYRDNGGAGQLFFLELPFLEWVDRQGLDVSYTTDYDLSVSPDSQPLPRVVVFNGHSEYWGTKLYDWLDQHIGTTGDLGLAMLAADTGYWPVAFRDNTPDGPRSFICLKAGPVPQALLPPGETPEVSASPSPTGSGEDVEERAQAGGLDSFGPDGPYVGSFLDQPLFGVRYKGITTALGQYSIRPDVADPRLLSGTGLAAGSPLGFIAGGEVDGVYPFAEWWGPLGGRYDRVFAEAADIPGRTPDRHWTAQAVWRELPSGGKVFSSGTFYWGWALDPQWGPAHDVPAGFGQLTRNILAFLGAQ